MELQAGDRVQFTRNDREAGRINGLAFHLTVGEAADCKAYDALIGLPERAPDALLAA